MNTCAITRCLSAVTSSFILVTAFVSPAYADHNTEHIVENLKGGLGALEQRVWDCEQGIGGCTGIVGATGPQGPAGATGPAGADGADGATGPAGPQGVAGADGADGATGPAGPQGDPGADGATGPAGPQGDPGSPAITTIYQRTVSVNQTSGFSLFNDRSISASCDANDDVMGGGCFISNRDSGFLLTDNPVGFIDQFCRWQCVSPDPTSSDTAGGTQCGSATLRVTAICLSQ